MSTQPSDDPAAGNSRRVRLIWFVALWCSGVGVLGVIGLLIKFALPQP